MKYWGNAWSNYSLTSLFKFCKKGDLKNATSEIILTSNKVSLLKWKRPAGDGKIKQGRFFSIILHFFSPDMVQLSKKKLFNLINALHYPIWHQHCWKVTIWGNPSLFLPIKRQIIHSLKRLSTSSYSWYYWSCQILLVYSATIMKSRKSILVHMILRALKNCSCLITSRKYIPNST